MFPIRPTSGYRGTSTISCGGRFRWRSCCRNPASSTSFSARFAWFTEKKAAQRAGSGSGSGQPELPDVRLARVADHVETAAVPRDREEPLLAGVSIRERRSDRPGPPRLKLELEDLADVLEQETAAVGEPDPLASLVGDPIIGLPLERVEDEPGYVDAVLDRLPPEPLSVVRPAGRLEDLVAEFRQGPRRPGSSVERIEIGRSVVPERDRGSVRRPGRVCDPLPHAPRELRQTAPVGADAPDLVTKDPVRVEGDPLPVRRPHGRAVLEGVVGQLLDPAPVRAHQEDVFLTATRREDDPPTVGREVEVADEE